MFDNGTVDRPDKGDELPSGSSLLRGQYLIEEYLVRGGFGITYLARDSLDRRYVIKECFPGALCCRVKGDIQPLSAEVADKYLSIRRHFVREARRLAKLDHPNIVKVHQVFEENNSAYMAMEAVNGEDLLSIIDTAPARLTPPVVVKALRDALIAIRYIHELGILHRDISPDNFLLGENNHLTLIDFGAAREQAGKENRALSALLAVKDGYSPHEFYLTDMLQDASSDLYSLGATFYHLITGEAPPNSQDRVVAVASGQPDPYKPLDGGDWAYDRRILASIDRALELLARDRIATAAEWLDLLNQFAATTMPDVVIEEGDLTRVISRLVEDTNQHVHQGMPGDAAQQQSKRKRRRGRMVDEAQDEGPKQLVDIFGNPVPDIDAWMREHSDGKSPKRMHLMPKKRAKAAAVPEPDAAEPEAEPAQGGGGLSLNRLISACLPGRRTQSQTILQNVRNQT